MRLVEIAKGISVNPEYVVLVEAASNGQVYVSTVCHKLGESILCVHSHSETLGLLSQPSPALDLGELEEVYRHYSADTSKPMLYNAIERTLRKAGRLEP